MKKLGFFALVLTMASAAPVGAEEGSDNNIAVASLMQPMTDHEIVPLTDSSSIGSLTTALSRKKTTKLVETYQFWSGGALFFPYIELIDKKDRDKPPVTLVPLIDGEVRTTPFATLSGMEVKAHTCTPDRCEWDLAAYSGVVLYDKIVTRQQDVELVINGVRGLSCTVTVPAKKLIKHEDETATGTYYQTQVNKATCTGPDCHQCSLYPRQFWNQRVAAR